MFLLVCFTCTYCVADTSDHYEKPVMKELTALMQQYQIPGAAVAIVDHGKTYIYVFGIANPVKKTPVTEMTLFELGSITKLFTALTFTLMANEKTQPDDFFVKYYPALKYNSYFQKITPENLLTHTSGLPFNLPENIKTADQAQNYFLNWRPEKPIGTEWQYSNVGVGLLGIAMQNKTHRTLDQLYRQYIFSKLNMNSAGVMLGQVAQPKLAQGYTEEGKLAVHSSAEPFPAAWGVKADIKDMSHFLALAVGDSSFSATLLRAMEYTQTPRLQIDQMQQGLIWQIHSLQDKTLLQEPEKMNLGPIAAKWLAKDQQIFNADTLIDKTGATEGFRAYIAVIPSRQLGIVILLNKYISNGAIVNAGRKVLFS